MKSKIKNSKLLKLPKPDYFCHLDLSGKNDITESNKKYERHTREIKDDGFPNPFALSNRVRLFSKEAAPRKLRPLPEIKDDVRTVCDIHTEFFKIIEVRPVKEVENIKAYMKNIRDLADCRTNIGFCKDEMERIDHDFREEKEQFEKVLNLCNACRKNYAQFLKVSFSLALESQEKAEKVVIKLDKIKDQLEEYSFEYVNLRNGLAVIVGNFEKLLRYKDFLTTLTPSWWQEKFDGQSHHSIENIHEKLNCYINLTSESVSSVISNNTTLTYSKPVIFFSEPSQLMSIFDDMARQGQLYLAVVNQTSIILGSVRKLKANFETTLKQSCADMQDDIERYKYILKYTTDREAECKTTFYEILFNDFRKLYADYENIKLHTCVEYACSQIFGESEDLKDKTITLMRRLEGFYMDLSSKLDFLDEEVVNEATKELFAKDIEVLSKARNAQRQLKLCDLLEKALYTSFEPPRNRFRKSRK